ncbi:hypothetical protein C8N24_1871 [Solirubrobacter pauli]|uniref:Uncharacterized protein n=1 Tax=Solirubrobacter pauli TaxID=166793 RepID=A0A660LAJ8_9ACTN|nr:hypothetical protein [Solirubrobacter pauli]RKQ92032.1 hypothetical protein C8N24_1871 [Solirubrobacter pauli]
MLASLVLFAQETLHVEEEVSKTPFYIAASALVAFALLLSAVGIARHETFPPSRAVARGLSFVMLILVAAAAYTAVITG